MIASCMVVAMAACLAERDPVDESTRPWEDRILAERQVIKRGSLRLQSELVYATQNNRNSSVRHIVKFAGDNLLLDSTAEGGDGGKRKVFRREGNEAGVYASTGLVDGKEIAFDFAQLTDYAKITRPLTKFDGRIRPGSPHADPLAIGLVPIDFLNTVHMRPDAMLRRADVASSSVVDGEFEGAACKTLGYVLKDGSVISVSFRDGGPLVDVLAVERTNVYKGTNLVERIVNRNKRYETPGGAVLYPERCTFTQTQNGHPIRSEALTIEVVSLNEPLEASAFTVAGMNLPRGTKVVEDPQVRTEHLIWDGEKVVPGPIAKPER